MTNSPGWVQNRGQYQAAGGQAAARCAKLRVERRPFLAPEAVIFGVVFTGPYILLVIISLHLIHFNCVMYRLMQIALLSHLRL